MNENIHHHRADDYLAGKMTTAEEREFEQHLKSCIQCRTTIDKFKALQDSIGKLPKDVSPARDLWPAIEARLKNRSALTQNENPEHRGNHLQMYEPENEMQVGLFTRRFVWTAAAIVFLFAGSLVWLVQRNSKVEVPPSVSSERGNFQSESLSIQTHPPSSNTQVGKEIAQQHTARQSEPLPNRGVSSQKGSAEPAMMDVSLGSSNSFLDHLQTSLVKFTDRLPGERIYLQLDKSLYSPGETIWYEAYIRNDENLLPSHQSDILHVEFIDPKGSVSQQFALIIKDGVTSGDIYIDENLPGGIYKVRAYTQWQKNLRDAFYFEKEIQIQNFVLPKLKMKLEFVRKAFGAGDNVTATVAINTLDNKPLAGTDIKYIVNIAGNKFMESSEHTDHSGMALVSFKLPKDLSTTDGLLGILVDHEGRVESISRSIPILLNKINVMLYPEGGDLVEGIESRVAFQATNEFGKPADVEGTVFDSDRKEVTSFKSFHAGMGTFTFIPESGKSYVVKITKPEGITRAFVLPDALEKGFTLATRTNSSDKLDFDIGSTEHENMSLVGQIRGRVYFTRWFKVEPGRNHISVSIADLPAGVLQATLFDGNEIERAERLIFVNKPKQLRIEISTDKERYLPREKVDLTIKAADDRGVPYPANLSLAVVDDKLISFADDKSGNIVSKMLLEPDLKEKVDEPNFYFDQKEPKADEALDYLMMTRGWRRFEWKEVLNGEPPAIQFQPERALIAGTVIDASTHQPIADASVTVTGTNQTVRTDSNGTFSIRNCDLSSPINLSVEKDQFMKSSTMTLFDYNENVRLQLRGVESELSAQQNLDDNRTKHTVAGNDQNAITHKAGKIIGKIIDQKSGEPIPGVNVLVVGTTRGAATDLDGKYTIIGVPTGNYTVRATQVGYGAINYSNVKIDPNVTTSLDFKLQTADVAIGEVAITPEHLANNFVTSGAQTVNSKSVEKLPDVKTVEDVLKTQAGFVQQGKNLFLRGGRANEVQYLVDGVPTNGIVANNPVNAGPQNGNVVNNHGIVQRPIRNGGRFYRARVFPAPIYSANETPAVRDDFRSTIFWQGDITLDRTGKTVISFYNSDEITSFRATVEGVGTTGLVGRAEKTYFTQLPLSVSAKLPTEVSSGDEISIPLTLKNNTDRTVTGTLEIKSPKGWKALASIVNEQVLSAGSAKTLYIPFTAGAVAGEDTFEVAFSSNGLRDAFQQVVGVKERGFPQSLSFSGNGEKTSYGLLIHNPIEGSVHATLTAYPTVTSDLISGIDAMFQEPGGCFEQTSSRNYPNILALRYLQENNIKNPSVMERATKLLDNGYKRLTGYETKEKGYEWFGSVPPHEALTAYGLAEFKDMELVYADVDKSMVDRTAAWLISRKDGKGGFLRNAKAVDSFGRANPDVTNAYIVYSLGEAGYTDIMPEVERAFQTAIQNQDPYQLALIANTLYRLNQRDHGDEIIDKLIKTQQPDGSWIAAGQSITLSSGISLKVETTSLVVTALILSKTHHPDALRNAVKFILTSRSGLGGFGSTQGTVLALKALTEYARYSKQTAESGKINVKLDGEVIARKSYEAGEQDPIVLGQLEQSLPVDDKNHIITIESGGSQHALPYTMLISWNTDLPRSSDSAKVFLRTKLMNANIRMGETVRLTTTVRNVTDTGLPMTIAVVGIPGGLTPQPWQLKELQEKGVYDFYEIIGREVVFYYRQIQPNEEKEINLDLKAEIPGTYESPASCAYLYYTSEFKSWDKAAPITIGVP